MQQNSEKQHTLQLIAAPEKKSLFSTLLQSGIALPCRSGTSLGVFLNSLPGFDQHYIAERIQTIFLDGNAVDDLERPLDQEKHVVALSAAMPGLAGAIFRRNSLCAALRIRPEAGAAAASSDSATLVLVKLFNMIAQEKGAGLLANGGSFQGNVLLDFFSKRPSLLDNCTAHLDRQEIQGSQLLSRISESASYHINITARC